MNDYGGGMTSADGITAAFLHKIPENINGTPSRIYIDNAQENIQKMHHHDLPQGEGERMDTQGWLYPQQDT